MRSRLSRPSPAAAPDLSRSAALEKVEEAADIEAYNEALVEDDGTRYSMDDAMRMAMEAE